MAKIKINENGPYMIQDLEKLTGSINTEPENKKVIALCRCGASRNKPFCDGMHKQIDFKEKS